MKNFVISIGVDKVEHILHMYDRLTDLTENDIREELKGFFDDEYSSTVQILEIKEV